MPTINQLIKPVANELKISTKSALDRPELFGINPFQYISHNPFTKELDSSLLASSNEIADIRLRPVSGKVWRHASDEERNSIYQYTVNSDPVNMFLRKQDAISDIIFNKNLQNLPKELTDIQNVTKLISKSTYDNEMVLLRGRRISRNKIDTFFQIATKDLQEMPENELRKRLKGQILSERGFLSTSAIEENRYSDYPIIMSIHAPKDTQMLYTEPFSAYGKGNYGKNVNGKVISRRNWNGIRPQKEFGDEMEVLLQQNSSLYVNDIQRNHNQLFIDLTVVDQNPRFIRNDSI